MGFFRNKIFILIMCTAAIFSIIFVGIPKYIDKTKETLKVIRVVDDVLQDILITENMLTTAEIGKFNAPKDIITDKKMIVGKYSSVSLLTTDNLVSSKFKDNKSMQDQFLYEMSDKVAISISVKSLATGLSGKLLPGDVVSVIVYSKNEQAINGDQGYLPTKGSVHDYPNLEYLEVGAVTNSKAQDTDQVKNNEQAKTSSSSSTDTIVPTTITLKVTKQQAKELVDAENSGIIHVIFRGRDQEAKKLLSMGQEVKSEKPEVIEKNNNSSQVNQTQNTPKINSNQKNQSKSTQQNKSTQLNLN